MSVIAQGIITIAVEIIALLCGIFLFKHKGADTVTKFCGLFCVIGVSVVILIEIGLTVVWIFSH